MSSSHRWIEFINNLTVGTLMVDGFQVIRISADATVPDVLRLLSQHQIQSCPVWDEAQQKYVGLIDFLDIVAVLVTMNDAKHLVDALSAAPVTWEEYLSHERHLLAEQKISDLCNLSERNPWCPVWQGTPLNSLLDMFGASGGSLHRVPVVDDAGSVVGLVTQSTVLKFLAAHLPLYHPDLLSRELQSLPALGSATLAEVDAKSTVFAALHALIDRSVSGLAVVREGALVGCFSASNLRGCSGNDLFPLMSQTVQAFLETASFRGAPSPSLHPIVVAQRDTVATLLAKIIGHHIHRVFRVDDQGVPFSVIALADLLSMLQYVSNQ